MTSEKLFTKHEFVMKKLLIFTLTYFYKFSQEITWKICIGESYLPQYRGLVFL